MIHPQHLEISRNRAMSTPYVEGINLHQLLISDEYPKSLRLKATELYQALTLELINDMHIRNIRFEVTPERPVYFIDKRIDGLNILRIESDPPLLIKTDNLIYNPADNTLTLVDPY